jgi:hypothetical protein
MSRRVQCSYEEIYEEWLGFEREFVPGRLDFHQLMELSFFVGAASAVAEPDGQVRMRIISLLSLVQDDLRDFIAKHGREFL